MKLPKKVLLFILASCVLIFDSAPFAFAGPKSSNYELKDYSFGSGAVDNAKSSNYSLNGAVGEEDNGSGQSSNYRLGPGLSYVQDANTPGAPTITKPDSTYYNKLHITINNANNPSDTLFSIAISTDNFTSTQYIAKDHTTTSTLSNDNFQTYTNWGGSSGFNVIGLTPGTTYYVKVAAMQGEFTESQYGPVASGTTDNPTFQFSVSPNTITMPQLDAGSVVTSASTVTVSMTSNGAGGAVVYAYDTNSGLKSTSSNYTISSATNDLSSGSVPEGYGLRGTATSQTTGGPMEILPPYNGPGGDTVGAIGSQTQPIFDTTNQPVDTGQGSFVVKAKIKTTTPAGSDYSDLLTVIGAATF